MNEENMNNLDNEETASLFVSSQKKKQAEEEARRKAAEEQARQEAAAAEVARMEAEVEARKRKAEEERRALEEKGKQLEAQRAFQAQQAAAGAKQQGSTRTPQQKLALSIGIGVGAVVLIAILILIIVSGSKKGVVNYDELAVDMQYSPANESCDTILYYPGSVYDTSSEDTLSTGGAKITFFSKHKKIPEVIFAVQNIEQTVGNVQLHAREVNDMLRDAAQGAVEHSETIEETVSDPSSDNPGNYDFRGVYTGDGNSYVVHAWYEEGESGNVLMEVLCCKVKSDYADNAIAMEQAIYTKNATDAIKSPGANPPTGYDWDGSITSENFHTRMDVPKDRYELVNGLKVGMDYWGDDNGSFIGISGEELGSYEDMAAALTEDNAEIYFAAFEEISQDELGAVWNYDERNLISETPRPNGGSSLDYLAEYQAKLNGISYYEQNYIYMTQYEGQVYIMYIVTLCPERNKETYTDIFTKSYSTLKTQ